MRLRSLLRDASAIGAVLILALGFGTSAAVFTAVNALMLKPLPYPSPEQLVAARIGGPSWSPAMLEAVRRHNTVFSQTAGVQERAATLAGTRRPESVRVESVSAEYFPLLGIRAASGRLFAADEDRRGVTPAGVVVVSRGLAERRFGTSEEAIGQTLVVDDRRVTIVGVLPRGFRGLIGRTDIWSPLAAARWLDGSDAQPERPTSRWFEVVGRLAPGIDVTAGNGRFAVEARRAIEEIPNWQAMFREPRASLVPLASVRATATLSQASLILLAGAGAIVLMAAMNLAGLQVARATTRRRELAVRLALGATPARLVAAIAREVAIVVGAGLAGAIWMRSIVLHLLLRLQPASPTFGLASADPFGETALAWDARLMWFMLAVAIATWLLIIVAPVLRATRVSIEPLLGSTPGSAQSPSLRGSRAMLIGQLAFATVLVIGASLLLRSAVVLATRDRGFNPDDVLTLRLTLPPQRYDDAATRVFYETLTPQIGALSGIEAAGVSNCAPGTGRCRRTNVLRVDGIELPEGQRPTVGAHFMTPRWLRAIGADVVEGREFEAQDSLGSPPVAIVSDALARRLWPKESPIGRRVSMFFANGRFTEDREVVGVIRSIAYDAVEADAPGDVYLPASQAAWSGVLFIRAHGDRGELEARLTSAIERIDSTVLISDVATMHERIGAGLADERFATSTLTAFAIAALLLAGIGAYALVRVSIEQRTRDIAIRLAIGATRGRIMREMIRNIAVPAVVGVAGGVMMSFALSPWLVHLLHGVSTRDAAAFVLGPAILCVCVAMASSGPAVIAGRIDPVATLKTS